MATGSNGSYQLGNVLHAPVDVRGFQQLSALDQYKTPIHANYDDLDHKYWQAIKQSVPIYGAEVDASLMDDSCKAWNLNRLGSILDFVGKDYGMAINGVTTSYLYFGMWKTSFAWHTEDMDLYSINYLHTGAPKTWYSIPTKHAREFEELSKRLLPSSYRICSSFLRHKTTLISPNVLEENGIPFNRVKFVYINLKKYTFSRTFLPLPDHARAQ